MKQWALFLSTIIISMSFFFLLYSKTYRIFRVLDEGHRKLSWGNSFQVVLNTQSFGIMSPLWECQHVTTSVNILRYHGLSHTLWICHGLFLVPHIRLLPIVAWAMGHFHCCLFKPSECASVFVFLPFVRVWAVSYFSIMNVVGCINYRLMAMPASPMTPQTDHEAYYGMTIPPSAIKEHSPNGNKLMISMNWSWKQNFLDYV